MKRIPPQRAKRIASQKRKSSQAHARRLVSVQSLSDLEKLEQNLPDPAHPPRSTMSPDKLALWQEYCDYCRDRAANMRADFKREGKTKRQPPRTFSSFCKAYSAGDMWRSGTRRGRQYQNLVDRQAAEITDGKIVCDLGVSRFLKPKQREVLYPDHVWQNADGSYSVASSKSRDFTRFTSEQLIRQIEADVDEAMQKYSGKLYVRRRGLRKEMPLIEVTEIVLNYDKRLIPARYQRIIREMAEDYARLRWPGCFFQLAFYKL